MQVGSHLYTGLLDRLRLWTDFFNRGKSLIAKIGFAEFGFILLHPYLFCSLK